MSAKYKPPFWFLFPVLGAALWIAFGVMAAEPPQSQEVRDPALERMIARFAGQARQAVPLRVR
jgi:hypothetical protein